MTQQTILAADAAELEQLEARIYRSVVDRVKALAEIHEKELYVTAGFGDFLSYAKERFEIGRAHAYRLLDMAEVLKVAEARNSPVGEKITHENLIRGLAGMKPENKLKCLEIASNVARQRNAPLTGPLVNDIAQKNMGWKPAKEYRESRKPEQDHTQETVELVAQSFCNLGLTGYELWEKLGSLDGIAYVREMFSLLKDWEDAE